MRRNDIQHAFVEFIPDTLAEGVLYVSIPYATATHKCCCGCGTEVVTPLSPTDWEVSFDGKSVSLYPSIGNWNFPCRSHYWIKKGRVRWAESWSKKQIKAGREWDAARKAEYFEGSLEGPTAATKSRGFLARLAGGLSKRKRKP